MTNDRIQNLLNLLLHGREMVAEYELPYDTDKNEDAEQAHGNTQMGGRAKTTDYTDGTKERN